MRPLTSLTLVALLATASPGVAQQADGEASRGSVAGTIVARDITVAEGETLVDIARRELGFAGLAGPLADANGLAPDAVLLAGQTLRIPIHVPAGDEFVVVIFVKGEASLNGEPLDSDAQVVIGDVVETGPTGFVALEFSSGAVVNLQPETRLTLQQLACLSDDDSCRVLIDATRGRVGVSVDTRDEQPTDFRVTTPFASAAVRGTEFELSAAADAMRVAVFEGDVQAAALGTSVDLPEGFGSVTPDAQPPSPPLPLAPSPVYRNVPARLAPGDAVRWWPLTDVERYRADWSIDSAGQQLVASVDVAGDALGPGEREPGDLFLTVRGIDADQLPGFGATTRVVIAGIDDAATAPAVTLERQAQEFLVRVENPVDDAAGFELQLSRTDDFADPLSVDVGPPGQAVFRLDADTVFARARQLITPQRVSNFGAVAELR